MRLLRLALVLTIASALLWVAWPHRDTPYHWFEAQRGARPLLAAKSWHYQLQKFDGNALAKNDADVFVIDYAKGGGREPLTRQEVELLKKKPDGTRRLVISYISIGEAEQYRYYWKPEFKDTPAAWDMGENCAWPQNNMVRFWSPEWKDTIIRAPDSYLRRIASAGFDGVYLDRIDVYGHMNEPKLDLETEMKSFVAEIKSVGSTLKPGFLVIAQNAEDLLEDRAYRNSIDGLGKEDLLYGSKGTNARNSDKDIGWSLERLNKLRADWKPIFAVEYPESKELASGATAELRKLGFVPTIQHRSLDGRDPAAPPPPSPPAASDGDAAAPVAPAVGSPEYIATVCKDKRWW